MTQARILQAYSFILLVIRVIFIFQQKHPDTTALYTHNTAAALETITTYNSDSEEGNTTNNDYNTSSLAIMEQEQPEEKPLLVEDYIQKQTNIATLEQLYTDNPNSELLYALINALLSQHRFVDANDYIQEALTTFPDSIDPYTHIYAVFHSPSLRISQV